MALRVYNNRSPGRRLRINFSWGRFKIGPREKNPGKTYKPVLKLKVIALLVYNNTFRAR